MELKPYQKEVIADLARYLELVVDLQSPAKAYRALWNEKNVPVGFGGMPAYVDVLPVSYTHLDVYKRQEG